MKKSTTAGIIIVFAGYAVISYGVVLLKGWNVPWRGWVDPLHPYRWPAGGADCIPPGQVFPGQTGVPCGAAPFGAANVAPSILNAIQPQSSSGP